MSKHMNIHSTKIILHQVYIHIEAIEQK